MTRHNPSERFKLRTPIMPRRSRSRLEAREQCQGRVEAGILNYDNMLEYYNMSKSTGNRVLVPWCGSTASGGQRSSGSKKESKRRLHCDPPFYLPRTRPLPGTFIALNSAWRFLGLHQT